jgi:hypothetical protein
MPSEPEEKATSKLKLWRFAYAVVIAVALAVAGNVIYQRIFGQCAGDCGEEGAPSIPTNEQSLIKETEQAAVDEPE